MLCSRHPREHVTLVQSLPNVTFGQRWVDIVQTSRAHWDGSISSSETRRINHFSSQKGLISERNRNDPVRAKKQSPHKLGFSINT